MTYNFINQSDESLDSLSSAIYEERKKRFYKLIHKWPRPEIIRDEEGRYLSVESIKLYRGATMCSLQEAKWVTDYYANE